MQDAVAVLTAGTEQVWGFVMQQGLQVTGWLGMGGLALILGNLYVWHTRRVLRRLPLDVPAPARVKRPAQVTDSTSSETVS
jgi:hypothetical protein